MHRTRFTGTCRSRRLAALTITGALTLLAGGLLAPAAGATVQSASLSMTSDAGDWVGGGRQYSYSTSAGDSFGSTTSAGHVGVTVNAADASWWHLDFAAPAGEALAVGTYDAATRYPFQDSQSPGLAVFGNGAGCNTLTGSFTVTQVTFAAGGAVETLDADFEQHCEGGEPALRGQLHLVNDPPPPPLTIELELSDTGTVTRAGTATISGTVTCNRPTTVSLSGTLTQRATRFAAAMSQFSRHITCTGTTPWELTVNSLNTVPFGAGQAQLDASALAFDMGWETVTDTHTGTVRLGR